jgi:hypothetical protein
LLGRHGIRLAKHDDLVEALAACLEMADQPDRGAVGHAGGVDIADRPAVGAGADFGLLACASSGASAEPTAKVAPSTSAAVMVMLTCLPSSAIVRVTLAGLAGKVTR